MRIVEGEAIRANRRLFRRNFVLHLSSQLSHLRCVNVALCAAGSDPARALCYSICRREFAVNSQYIFAVYFRSILKIGILKIGQSLIQSPIGLAPRRGRVLARGRAVALPEPPNG